MKFARIHIPESDYSLWVIFFLYTLLVGVSIQCFVLPFLFPQFTSGAGLLFGTDSVFIHKLALEQSTLIQKAGWQNWVLSPLGQTMAGITSFFYAILTPKPWIMLPIQGALFAGSAYLLFKILSLLDRHSSRRARVTAVIPFLVFPSAVIIYAQLLKDSFFIFGNLLFIYGWLWWLRQRNRPEGASLLEFGFTIILFALAYLLVWIVRPYWGPIFFLFSLAFFILLTINQIRLLFNEHSYKEKGVYWISSLVLVIVFALGIQQRILPRSLRTEAPGNEQLRFELTWTPSKWLPSYLDARLQSLSSSRKAFALKYPEAGTNLDTDVIFQNAGEILRYLPRAFYIGFFMPSLSMAFHEGKNPGGTIMRRVTAFEMIFLYLCYPFLLITCWAWRKKMEFWVFFTWALGGILIYTLSSPNIGALYRFRYGFIMSLSALGLLKAITLVSQWKQASL